MAYVTYDQYVKEYGKPPITEDEFPIYAECASTLIDSITQYRIVKAGGIGTFPKWVQEIVQKACAAQVMYFTQVGLETALTGQAGQSFTVGKVSVSGGALSSTGQKAGNLMISPLTAALLEQTPLMERGVQVCSDRFLNPFWGI